MGLMRLFRERVLLENIGLRSEFWGILIFRGVYKGDWGEISEAWEKLVEYFVIKF